MYGTVCMYPSTCSHSRQRIKRWLERCYKNLSVPSGRQILGDQDPTVNRKRRHSTMYSSSATAQDAYSATYKRYKTDTDTIAAWLFTTAKDRGYNVTGLHEPSAGPRTGSRPKGKARTAAKQAQVNADTVQNVVVKTYRINIPDFVALAQYIANLKKPRVKTPDYLAHSLHQAIKGRKRL